MYEQLDSQLVVKSTQRYLILKGTDVLLASMNEGLSSAVSACANALQWQEALVLLQPQKPVP